MIPQTIKLLLILFFISAAGSICMAQSLKPAGNAIAFIENKGQVIDTKGNMCSDILFSGDGAGAKVFLRKGGVSYVMASAENAEQATKDAQDHSNLNTQRVDMDFAGSNSNAKIQTEEIVSTHFNYYLEHCPQGITRVSAYKKITYLHLYPNIDVSFYGGKSEGMEYDFIVNPGGDPENIQIKYSGTENLYLTAEGRLEIKTQIGEIKEWIPSTYQNINGKKVQVKSRYELNGTSIKFHVGNYDKTKPLIIDPWTTWITYMGGSVTEKGMGLATDASGNVCVTGYTTSINFPVLAGFQMSTGGGTSDAYVAKFDGAGNLLWATYYGGSLGDFGKNIATDASGNIFFTGSTSSTNFPVLAGAQMSNGGSGDAIVVKFNSAGTRIWATYFGGSLGDAGSSISTDSNGDVFITGNTSGSFPVSSGFQMSYGGGGSDAFVVKFNSSGTALWSTYFGGSGSDAGYGVSTDASGNAFISGATNSANFPTLAGFQMGFAGGNSDLFAAKFSATGTNNWATYYGGSSDEEGNGISTDGSGNVFVTGYTKSTNFPVIAGYQMSFAGGTLDAFVIKFNNSGIRQWATYYGGSLDEEGFGITADAGGNSFITGDTYSTDFPVTAGACQPVPGGGTEDNYLVSFDPAGNRLCATYVGGSGHDEEESGGNISLSGSYVYITGLTPGSFPVSAGAYQTVHGGGPFDVFIAQLPKDCNCTTSTLPVVTATSTPVCSGLCTGTATAATTGGSSPYTYVWSNTETTQTISGLCGGTYSVIVTDAAAATSAATVTVAVSSTPTATITANTTNLCTGQNATLNGSGGGTYLWSNGVTSSSIMVSPTASTTYTLTVTNTSGCSDTTSQTLIVTPFPFPPVTGNTSICAGDNTTLTASGGTTYSWTNGATTSAVSVAPTSTTTYSVIISSGSCSDTSSIVVNVNANPAVSINGTTILCTGQSTTLSASGGTNYSWSTGATTSSITTSAAATYSVVSSNANGCTAAATVTVTVSPPPSAVANSTTICAGQTATINASGGATYVWNTGATTSSIIANASASYTVVVSVGNCSDTAFASVTVDPVPVVSVSADVTISQGQSTTLSASGGGNYSWNNGASASTITVNPSATTQYCVFVVDAGGCSDSSCVTVFVEPMDCSGAGELFIPNAFSPNGDAENDVLKLYYGNMACIKTYKLVIYNRWGEKVFESSDPLSEWNGVYKDKTESSAVFTYYLEAALLDGKEVIKKGNISLVK